MQRSKKKQKRKAVEERPQASPESPLQPAMTLLSNRAETIVVWLILATALVFRVWDLEIKPPHFDEGINGFFVSQVWKNGFHKYDPTNFHGPLYFYILQLAEIVFGRGIWGFRYVTGLLSMGIVAVVILHRRFIGQAAVWAGAIIALSPGFIFYSRYAIHESLFILTQVVFSYGFFLWWERRNLRAVCLMVGAIVAMIATKETFFIFFGTWFIAVFATDISLKMFPSLLPAPYRLKEQEREPLDPGDIWAVISLGVVVLIFLFTGFLMYMHGAIDMVTAMTAWTKTGVASTGHEKPFYFWLQILTTYEWSFLGALVLSPIAFLVANRNGRVLILSGIGIWIAYSIIPYKTPWLVLNILWLIAVALGVMIADGTALLRKWKIGFTQPLICLLALAATGYSTYTSWRLNFRDFTKVGEPYVYVQTTLEFKRVTDILEESLRRKPEALTMKIAALNSDPWPLPWVLDIYPNLQWGKVATSDLKNLQLILIDAVDKQLAEAKMTGQFYVLPFQIRDSYQAGFAYLSVDQFKGLLPEATPMFTGNTATPVSDGDHP